MTPAGPPLYSLGIFGILYGETLTFGSLPGTVFGQVSWRRSCTWHGSLHQRTFPSNQDRATEAQDGEETKSPLMLSVSHIV